MMLRKNIKPKITNAMKFSDERAYNRSRSPDVSIVKVFQRLLACSMTSKTSDATISVPTTHGVFRLLILVLPFSTLQV